MEKANTATRRMQEIAKAPGGTKTEEYRQAQRAAKDVVVAAAQSADYVRRTFAEEFSSMAMGMPGGTHLMPSMPSGYAQFGPAALTSPEGGVRYGRDAGFTTREQQIEGMFGNKGRSHFDAVIRELSNAAEGHQEASELSMEASNALYKMAVAWGAEMGSGQ